MHNPTTRIDWHAAATAPGMKQTGADEYHGACPVTGAGKDTWHVCPTAQLAGCRKCGDGAGKLTGRQLIEHMRACGAVAAAPLPHRRSTTMTTDTDRRQHTIDKRCGTCRYFDNEDTRERGLCRLRPPVPAQDGGMAIWPECHEDDWCGKYEADSEELETAGLVRTKKGLAPAPRERI